jgi:integrase
VDFKKKTVYIPGSQAKAGKGIAVPLNADAIEVLKRWVGKDERWVFVFRGKPVYQVTTATWRRACVAAGIPGFRFHDLRHTWASWQVQGGTPLIALQEMGGWSSYEMVKRYAHLSPGHLRQYADNSLLKRR